MASQEPPPEPQKPLHVIIKAAETPDVKFSITRRDFASILAKYRQSVELCWFSNCACLKRVKVADSDNIILQPPDESDFNENSLTLHLVTFEYSEVEALQHAQLTARILFTATSHSEFSDCRQSVVAWISRTCSKIAARSDDYTLTYPINYLNQIPSIVKRFDLTNSAVTPIERLNGIVFKMSITTTEKNVFEVKCARNGWFVNPDTVYVSLHLLLKDLSPFFKENCDLVADKYVNLTMLEQQAYVPPFCRQVFTPHNPAKKLHQQLRLFNPQFNNSIECTLDDSCQGADDRSTTYFEEEYVRSIMYAISLIKRGRLQHVQGKKAYYWRGLFFTNIRDLPGAHDEKMKIAARQPFFYDTTSGSDDFTVVRSTCIDLFADRWLIQQAIPGQLHGTTKVVFGYNADHSQFQQDERFVKFFQDNAKTLRLAPSPIKGAPEAVIFPANVTGIAGSDGKMYLTDIHSLTPRDANYPQLPYAVIRREARLSYEVDQALEAHKDELIALGGSPEFQYRPDPSAEKPDPEQVRKLIERRSEIISGIGEMTFDINALTPDSACVSTPQNITDLAKYLKEKIIPQFISEYFTMNSFFYDGHSLTREMHQRGINIRYLGYIHGLLDKTNPYHLFAQIIIESEMIARTIKHQIRRDNLKLPQAIEIINKAILGDLSAIDTSEYYGVKVETVHDEMFQHIMSSTLAQLGLRIALHKATDPLKLSDIVEIVPVVKYPFHRNKDFQVLVELATTCYMGGDHDSAFKFFTSAIQIGDQAASTFDPMMSTSFFYLALLLIGKGDPEGALDCILRSAMIHERYVDQHNPELIVRLAILSQVYHQLGNAQLAYAYAARVGSLSLEIAPSHPWTVTALSSASDLGNNVDPATAAVFARAAIELATHGGFDAPTIANLVHQASVSYLKAGEGASALAFAEKAVEIHDCPELRGALDLIKGQINLVPKPAGKK